MVSRKLRNPRNLTSFTGGQLPQSPAGLQPDGKGAGFSRHQPDAAGLRLRLSSYPGISLPGSGRRK